MPSSAASAVMPSSLRPAHAQADLVAPSELASVHPRLDLLQVGLGGCEQFLALVRAQLGQLRIAARHQALARIVRRAQFEQVALIEQVELQLPLFDQRADRGTPQCGDPAHALGLVHLVDGLVGDHAAVAHHHQLLDAELLAQSLDLWQQGLAVGDVAFVH